MEGVGCEAASLAGHLKLSNLCWIYDDNKISIEDQTDVSFSEDVGQGNNTPVPVTVFRHIPLGPVRQFLNPV